MPENVVELLELENTLGNRSWMASIWTTSELLLRGQGLIFLIDSTHQTIDELGMGEPSCQTLFLSTVL